MSPQRRLFERHAGAAAEEDVEAPAGQLDVIDDHARGGDPCDPWLPSLVELLGVGDEDDRQHAVGVERVAHHGAVARLEDVQRHERSGEEHGRQREEREGRQGRRQIARPPGVLGFHRGSLVQRRGSCTPSAPRARFPHPTKLKATTIDQGGLGGPWAPPS